MDKTKDLEKLKKNTKEAEDSFDFSFNLDEMTAAGLQFGHKTSKVHPKMQQYISGARNAIHIVDVEKSAQKLKEALIFIKQVVSDGKTILFIGTKIQVKALVKEIAMECGFPYVNERWLGGTFTNFEIIKKRVAYFNDLIDKKQKGELEKYTKKERLQIDRKLEDLEKKFGGIKVMDKLPNIIFVLDIKKDLIAVKEAKAKGIKVVGISDTNTNPELLDYAIPANDDAVSSAKYILEKVKEVVLANKSKI